jgi:hypothetical protein
MRWGSNRQTRAAYERICDIPLTIAPDELKRRVEVFGTDHFGIVPSIDLHGFQFRVVMPDAEHDEPASPAKVGA